MSRRNTLLYYLFFLVTGGLFGFYWSFLMAGDIATEKPSHIPRLRQLGGAFACGLVVYFGLVGYLAWDFFQRVEAIRSGPVAAAQASWPPGLFFVGVALAIALGACWLYVTFRVAEYVRERGIAVPSNPALFLLLFVYGASLPILQSRLNRLAAAGG
jgi:NO-binding membrane sensor protein with MHYT domain